MPYNPRPEPIVKLKCLLAAGVILASSPFAIDKILHTHNSI
jgi:hypothetical protein